jgi:hypothetical protein
LDLEQAAVSERPPPTTPTELADETLSFIYRALVPVRDLNRALEIASEYGDLRSPDTLEAAVGPIEQMAGFFETWQPGVPQ